MKNSSPSGKVAKTRPSAGKTGPAAAAGARTATGNAVPPSGVVGIGASAGGLEALEQFLAAVPADSGLAWVVVQHLDPDKKSALAGLLQQATRLPVVEISDRLALQADHCYVAPPGFEVSLLHGNFHLLKPAAPRGHGLPIDSFLKSLALDQQGHAAAVILSGMGHDGTSGARELSERAGAVFVQAPETAGFDAMPASTIKAGLATAVAAPDKLPARIVAWFASQGEKPDTDVEMGGSSQAAIEKLLILVRAQTSHDFSLYKKGTVYRRIQRRMGIHQLPTLDRYVQYVQENPIEAELLYKELLIGVTSFFRDPEVWDELRKELLPKLMAGREDGAMFRAWVAACSTGEEAYTLAMVFAEAVAGLPGRAAYGLQIFATDLEKDAINKARAGFYPDSIADTMPPQRLKRFFTQVPGGYRVSKQIRETVIFAQQSIASDPPFARLDILSCRNLLIYLEAGLQQKLLPLFHHSLNPGGLLVLGSAETVGQSGDLFVPTSVRTRIFRRLDVQPSARRVGFPIQSGAGLSAAVQKLAPHKAPPIETGLQVLADQVLARRYAPSSVLVTAQGDIVYFSGKTGKYLEPGTGKANLNLFAMARPGLTQHLSEVFYRAVRQKAPGTIDEVTVNADGRAHTFKVMVEPLDEPEALRGLTLVVFSDLPGETAATPAAANAAGAAAKRRKRGGEPESTAPDKKARDARTEHLMQELLRSREEHQATREEMQIAQESLLSANEELQSANEELTTSREEIQSINEELQTVNTELQARVDALARASDDMENLLNSTDIATLFLDQHLNVRRFTNRATSLIKLIPGDAGRPITDIVSDMDYANLAGDAREVLKTLMFKEKEVSATGGRWFMVRTMPYRTQDNRIDGLVITFTDISAAKKLEASLRKVKGGSKA